MKDNFYPVFMMTHELGDRGENYRAPGHPLGIALLIAATFPDARTRIQTLWRVERFNDKALRIQDTTFDEIDLDKQSDKMALIQKANTSFKSLMKNERPTLKARSTQAVEE